MECRIPWGFLDDLLCRPSSGGLPGDVGVDDATAMVGEHDEEEKDWEGDGGHGEEIRRPQVVEMIGQESAPGL